MKKNTEKVRSRREFFAGTLRYATLGLIASASTGLFAKRRKLLQQGLCINSGICNGCKILENCDLPPAVWSKTNPAGVNNGKE